MSRAEEYYQQVRDANRAIWDGINQLKGLQREWNALDYGTTLPNEPVGNEGIMSAELGAVVFDSANALEATLASGHATNMAKLL